jgi:small GTP-binding protein
MNDSTSEYEEKDLFKLKITLIGNSSVGKTSLIYQYMNNSFNEIKIATIGCDKFSSTITINNKEIALSIWDTAGQERFRSLSQMFIKNSDICMLVYDITNELSFNDLKDYWLNLVKENLSNIIIGVIANKSDLYPEEVVHEETGRKFAEKEGLYFYITSAKEHQSILTVFNDLINKYVEKYGFVHNYSSFDNSANDGKHSINSNSTSKKKKVACCN